MAQHPSLPAAPAPFQGFGPGALAFLEGLAANQTRDWFLAHQPIWERDLRRPLGALVEALSLAFAAEDIPLTGDAKRSLFRINRDIRFSKDKRPYKTNAGAAMTRDGEKMAPGVLYIQIGGETGSFMAAGFYGPDSKDLAAFRTAIAQAPARWMAIEGALSQAGLAFSMADAVTRPPRGFEALAGSPVAEALKRRNHIVSRPISPERLGEADLVADIVGFARTARPLLDFGWSALDRARGAT
jgi:uncharacterized protein (TIGR02453 family)